MSARFLAFDLGAESGRAILARLDAGVLTLKDVCRFPNEPVRTNGSLQWDILRYVGVYAQLGISFQFLRSFYFNPDLTAGVQARFP